VLEKAVRLSNRPNAVAWLAYAYGASGSDDAARRVVDGLVARSKTGRVSSYHLAIAYLAIHDIERTLLALEEAAHDPSEVGLLNLKSEPAWDPLRSNPRFHTLLDQLNLDR
jgi:hypothetical protein